MRFYALEREAAEIRDPIHGYIYADELEKELIDTPTFQRLRRIRQLASAYLTYPGAQHSRFEHSVGAMYLAGRASKHLASRGILDKESVTEIRAAALLHDIGHGPFSHLFEELLLEKKNIVHEDLTRRIIIETEIKDVLVHHGINPKKFANLPIGISKDHPRYVNDIIAGFLSVDTMDYLLRDSYFTGVEYGRVDVHRVINSYEVVNERLSIEKASIYALESLLLARYEMFRTVYFHRTVRAGAIMLVKAMSLSDAEFGFTDISSLPAFLKLTDEVTLSNLVNLKSQSRDGKFARQLAIDYRDRRMLKLVFEKVVQRKDEFLQKIFSRKMFRDNFAEEISERANVPSRYVFVDVPTTPSVPTTSSRESISEILLVTRDSQGRRIETIKVGDLPIASAILGYMDILRVYTFSKYRKDVETAMDSIFEREGFIENV